MSDVFLDESKAIVQWYSRVFDRSQFVSAAVAGRLIPGTQATDTEIIRDALEDQAFCNEIYAEAVADSVGQPSTDQILGKVWSAFQSFLEAAWAYADSGPRSSKSPERCSFDVAYGSLLKAMESLFPRLPRVLIELPVVSEQAEQVEVPEPDGPCGILQWRHGGEVSRGAMTEKPFRVASYLHERIGRRVSFGDIHSAIWTDKPVGDDTIARHGRNATAWFMNQVPPIPLDIKSSGGFIWMEKMTTEE